MLIKSFKKVQETQKGIDGDFINKTLKHIPNYAGVFSQDEIYNITNPENKILIVNMDESDKPGSHWIVINITETTLEIFDSLGFQVKHWPRFLYILTEFMEKHLKGRSLKVSPQIQTSASALCGLYCIYFVLARQTNSFKTCSKYFSTNVSFNSRKLLMFFKSLL